MRFFDRRRIRNVLLTVAVVLAVTVWVRAQHNSLARTAYLTGYTLYAAVGVLALYNLRKKLPGLPLGTSAGWLQLHIYIGIGSVAVFALHTGAQLPNGPLELALAVIYLATVTSGLWGLYLSRTIPAQLTRTGEQFTYERIPALRRKVQARAMGVLQGAVETSGATTLAEFYAAFLYDYLERPRSLRYLFRPTTGWRKRLLRKMHDLKRYLNADEQQACEKLFPIVRTKDDLDFHEARQRLLKLWLFGHVALTYSLVLLATLHGVVALAFRGDGG
ncbi:MAG: hypothetical protein WD851_23665 [Pirellulales bacterium]